MAENLYSDREELFPAFAPPAPCEASDGPLRRDGSDPPDPMAWSNLLERRFVPPTARIAVDAACIGCGYNLRGVRALGPCPECGRKAIDSLARSGAGRRCARSLALVARSLAAPMAAMVLLLAGFGNLGFALLMGVGMGFRMLAMHRLRRDLGGIDSTVATRVGWLRTAVFAEVLPAGMTVGAGVVLAVRGSDPMIIAVQVAGAFFWLLLSTGIVLAALQVVRTVFALRDPDRAGWETLAGGALAAIAGIGLSFAFLGWMVDQMSNVATPMAPGGAALGAGLFAFFLAAWGTWGLLLLAGLALERSTIDPAAMIDEELVTGAEAFRRTSSATARSATAAGRAAECAQRPVSELRLADHVRRDQARDPRRPTPPDRSPGPAPPPC